VNPEEEIATLQAIIDEILQGIQDILQSGEILSDDFQGLIAQELGETMDRITQLQEELQENPVDGMPPNIPEIPQLDQAPYESSNINSFKYNPDSRELFIKFHGRDTADSGPTYSYQDIPPNIYDVFRRGAVGPRTSGSNRYHTWHRNILPSLGAAAYQLIREGGYQYQRVG
jgi:hypothetical protein